MRYDSARIARLDMKYQALELRKAGWSYRQIAEQLGCSPSSARVYVKQSLEDVELTTQEEATELRQIILGRIEEAISAIYPAIQEGELYAIDRLIKLNDQAAVMVGAKIERHDVTSAGERMSVLNADSLVKIMREAKEEVDSWKRAVAEEPQEIEE